MSKICPNCGATADDSRRSCPKCGMPLCDVVAKPVADEETDIKTLGKRINELKEDAEKDKENRKIRIEEIKKKREEERKAKEEAERIARSYATGSVEDDDDDDDSYSDDDEDDEDDEEEMEGYDEEDEDIPMGKSPSFAESSYPDPYGKDLSDTFAEFYSNDNTIKEIGADNFMEIKRPKGIYVDLPDLVKNRDKYEKKEIHTIGKISEVSIMTNSVPAVVLIVEQDTEEIYVTIPSLNDFYAFGTEVYTNEELMDLLGLLNENDKIEIKGAFRKSKSGVYVVIPHAINTEEFSIGF